MQYRRARLQLDRIGADDDAPEPPSLTAARHEQMDDALKNKGGGPELADEEAPANPLPQGYNIDEEMGSEENAQKRPELFDENDTPMPDEHAATLHEIVDAKKVTQGQPSTVQRGSASSPSSSFPPFSQRGNIRRVLPSANTSYRQPTGASEETSSTQPPALEATLVQSVEATLLVENQPSPVYVATQVQEDGSQSDEEPLPWWEENQKYIFTGLVVLVFGLMAAVIGALVGSQPDNTSQESNTSQGGSVASTTAPYYAPTFTPSEALTTSPTTQDGCPKGQCLDPANTCMDRVNCFAHPCDVNSCNNIQNCTANFCGGCHAVCTPSVEQTSAGECTEMLSSDSYGDENFDHSSLIGGNHQIDKITKIEVFTGNYFFNTVSFLINPETYCMC